VVLQHGLLEGICLLLDLAEFALEGFVDVDRIDLLLQFLGGELLGFDQAVDVVQGFVDALQAVLEIFPVAEAEELLGCYFENIPLEFYIGLLEEGPQPI
jgi:hypothetical protein